MADLFKRSPVDLANEVPLFGRNSAVDQAGQAALFPQQPQPPLGPKSPEVLRTIYGGEFTRGLRRGLTGLYGETVAGGGQLAEFVGADETAKRLFDEARQIIEPDPNLVSEVPEFKDVHGPGDFGKYFAAKSGEMLPMVGAGLAAGLGGRAAGVGLRALGSKIRPETLGLIAGGGALAPVEFGSAALGMQNDPQAMANTTPGERTALAAGQGVVNSALMFAPQAVALRRAFAPVLARPSLKTALGEVGVGAAEGSLGLGLASGLQHGVRTGVAGIANPERDTSQDLAGLQEAVAAGMIGGLPFGVAGGLTHAVRGALKPPELPDLSTGAKQIEAGYRTAQAIDEGMQRAGVQVRRAFEKLATSVDKRFKASLEPTDAKRRMFEELLSDDSPVREALMKHEPLERQVLMSALDAIETTPKLYEKRPELMDELKTALGMQDLTPIQEYLRAKATVRAEKQDAASEAAKIALEKLSPEEKARRLQALKKKNVMQQAMADEFERLTPKRDEVTREDEGGLPLAKEESGTDIKGDLKRLFPVLEKPITKEILQESLQGEHWLRQRKATDKTQASVPLYAKDTSKENPLSAADILKFFKLKDRDEKGVDILRDYTDEELADRSKQGYAKLHIRPWSLAQEVSRSPKRENFPDDAAFEEARSAHFDSFPDYRNKWQKGTDDSRKADLFMYSMTTLLNEGMDVVGPDGKTHHIEFRTGTKGLPENLVLGKMKAGKQGYTLGDYKREGNVWTSTKDRKSLRLESKITKEYEQIGDSKEWSKRINEEIDKFDAQRKAARGTDEYADLNREYQVRLSLKKQRGRLAAGHIMDILRDKAAPAGKKWADLSEKQRDRIDAAIKEEEKNYQYGVFEMVSEKEKNAALAKATAEVHGVVRTRNIRATAWDDMKSLYGELHDKVLDRWQAGERTPELIEDLRAYLEGREEISPALSKFLDEAKIPEYKHSQLTQAAMRSKEESQTPAEWLLKQLEWVGKKAEESEYSGVRPMDEITDILERGEAKSVEGRSKEADALAVQATKMYYARQGNVDAKGNVFGPKKEALGKLTPNEKKLLKKKPAPEEAPKKVVYEELPEPPAPPVTRQTRAEGKIGFVETTANPPYLRKRTLVRHPEEPQLTGAAPEMVGPKIPPPKEAKPSVERPQSPVVTDDFGNLVRRDQRGKVISAGQGKAVSGEPGLFAMRETAKYDLKTPEGKAAYKKAMKGEEEAAPAALKPVIKGDIWEQPGIKIVTTNLGGVHGRGLAAQAKGKGLITPKNRDFDSSPFDKGVITIAVKGREPSTRMPGKGSYSEQTVGKNVELLKSELDKLIAYARKHPDTQINLPFAGLGFGEGKRAEIMPLLENAAREPNIHLISRSEEATATHAETLRPGVRSDASTRETPKEVTKIDPRIEKLNTAQTRLRTTSVPMRYVARKGELRADLNAKYPSGAPMTKLIADGVRTGTTRTPPMGVYTGDTISFPGVEGQFRVTGFERVDLKTPEGRAKWEQREGWSAEAAMRRFPDQVKDGAIQMVFERVEDKPFALAMIGADKPILLNPIEWNTKKREYISRGYLPDEAETMLRRSGYEKNIPQAKGERVRVPSPGPKRSEQPVPDHASVWTGDTKNPPGPGFRKGAYNEQHGQEWVKEKTTPEAIDEFGYTEAMRKAEEEQNNPAGRTGYDSQRIKVAPKTLTKEQMRAKLQAEADAFAGKAPKFVQNNDAHGSNYSKLTAAQKAKLPGKEVELVRKPDNPVDPNAIAIEVDGVHHGYVSREHAAKMAPRMDSGEWTFKAKMDSTGRFTIVKAEKIETGPSKVEQAVLQKEGETARKTFLREIVRMGGVSLKEAPDIVGEKGFRANQGGNIFRANGKHPDLIAERLHELGYISDAEYRSADGGVERVRELIRSALDGEVVAPLDEIGRLQAKPMIGMKNAGPAAPITQEVAKRMQATIKQMFGKMVELRFDEPEGAKLNEKAWYAGRKELDEYTANMAKLKQVRELRRAALLENKLDEVAKLEAMEDRLLKRTQVLSLIHLSPRLAEREHHAALYHESAHAAFDILLTPEERATLATAFTKGTVANRLRELFKDEAEVLAHMKDAEEAAAYGFQIYATAPELLNLGGKVNTIFGKVQRFFNKLFGMLSVEEKAKIIMDNVLSGRLVDREISPVQRVLEKNMTKTEKVQKLARTFGTVVKMGWDGLATSSYERMIGTNNPALSELAKRGYTKTGSDTDLGYIHANRAAMARFVNGMDKTFKAMDLKDINAAAEARIRGEVPSEPGARKAYDALNRFFKEMHQYSVDAGVKIGFEKNYFPMGWNAEKVANNREAFLTMIKKPEYAAHMAKLKVTPMELWENISNYITQGESFQDIIRTKTTNEPANQYALERSLSFIKPEDRRPFMEDNHLKTLLHYTQQTVRQAEYVRAFGHGGETMTKLLKVAEKKYGATPKQLAMAKDYVDGLLGDKAIGMSRAHKDLYGAIIVYQNLRLLPLNLFSSLVDPLGIAVRSNSLKDAGTAFMYNMKNIFRDLKKDRPYMTKDKWEKLAEDWGVIEDAGLMSNIGGMYENLDIRGTSKAIQEAFFKYNLLNGWERNTKIMATKAAERFMLRLKEDFFGEHNERYLKELGLDKTDLVVKPDGELALRAEEMQAQGVSETNAKQIEKRLQDATVKFVNQSVLNPTAGDLPGWGSNPYYAPIFHLKQFMFTFQSTILRRIVDEAKQGNYKPLWTAGVYVPGMIGADMMRGFIQNYGSLPSYQKDWDTLDYIYNGVDRSGLTGTGSFLTDYKADVNHGGTGFESGMGPALEQFKQGVLAIGGGPEAKFNFFKRSLPGAPLFANIGMAQPRE